MASEGVAATIFYRLLAESMTREALLARYEKLFTILARRADWHGRAPLIDLGSRPGPGSIPTTKSRSRVSFSRPPAARRRARTCATPLPGFPVRVRMASLPTFFAICRSIARPSPQPPIKSQRASSRLMRTSLRNSG